MIHRIGAVLILRDGTIINGYNHRRCVFKSDVKDSTHAEMHCIRRLPKKLLKGAVMYVARLKRTGELGFSKPCEKCYPVLSSLGIKVYYSD